MIIIKTKKTSFLFLTIVLAISVMLCLTSCSMNEEDGPRNITEKYFEAVKSGDIEGAIKCFEPAMQKQWEAALSFSSMFGKELTGSGLDKSIFEAIISGADAEAYKDCEFSVKDVKFTDEKHEHAIVNVTIEGAPEGAPNTTKVNTVLYDGNWYVKG